MEHSPVASTWNEDSIHTSSVPRAIIFGESSRWSRIFFTGETLVLQSDKELFKAEIDPANRAVDFDGENEDEFVAEDDFLDSSDSQVLIPDNLLAPDSTTIVALSPELRHWDRLKMLNLLYIWNGGKLKWVNIWWKAMW